MSCGMALRITDEQREQIRAHFPEEHCPDDRPGRKPVPARQILEGALWIPNTGAQWHMLPQCHPNCKTVHRRFQQWCRNDVLRRALCGLANTLRDSGAMDETECFIDAAFAPAKGGGDGIGPARRGKGVKIMGIVDRNGLPPAVSTHAANRHEATLVQSTSDSHMIEAEPAKLIGDRAYDSDKLAGELREDGVEMISPHRSNRTMRKTPAGRPLRRCKRRWLVGRFRSWLQRHRRLVVRWECHAENFPGFVQPASICILLERF